MTESAAPEGPAARRWREALEEWRIPPEILADAPGSPWVLPVAAFAARARAQVRRPDGVSHGVAAAALPAGGSVLDVGAGAGAACLALRDHAGSVIAVDQDPRMLARFADLAAAARLAAAAVTGRWPDVAGDVGEADVVVCHHVLYNVPDIVPFVAALTSHARRRVVVEISARHPQSLFNPLWMAVHGLRRPEVPLATDAVAAIAETGVEPKSRAWRRQATREGASWAELVDSASRRLCVGPSRRADVERALREAGASPEHPYVGNPLRDRVTIWWDTAC